MRVDMIPPLGLILAREPLDFAAAMFGAHGRVGGSIFLAAYALAVFAPSMRLIMSAPPGTKAAVLVTVIAAGTITVFSIRAHGGGGAGEGLGILAGILAWAGLYAVPALAPGLAEPDALQVAGASTLPLLMIAAVWGLWFAKRRRIP